MSLSNILKYKNTMYSIFISFILMLNYYVSDFFFENLLEYFNFDNQKQYFEIKVILIMIVTNVSGLLITTYKIINFASIYFRYSLEYVNKYIEYIVNGILQFLVSLTQIIFVIIHWKKLDIDIAISLVIIGVSSFILSVYYIVLVNYREIKKKHDSIKPYRALLGKNTSTIEMFKSLINL